MKNKVFAVLGFLLVFGFVLIGCDTGTNGGGGSNDTGTNDDGGTDDTGTNDDGGTDDTGTNDGGGTTHDIGNYTGVYTGDFEKSDYTSADSAEITAEEFIIRGEHYSGTKVSGGASQSGVQYAGQTFTMTWAYLEVENEKAGIITSYGNQKHELFLGFNSGFTFTFVMDILNFKNELPDWGLITWDKWEGEGEKDN
jgi:hypothetical protein